ncbi:MAG TPA: hypothetical protein PLC90_09425 [Bacteroidales bacterium]|nr:hypothetical protein [Bacteroidales bacterium]
MIFRSIRKAKNLIAEFRDRLNDLKATENIIRNLNAELEWADIYHDTIRGKKWLRELSISPGRWAANYSFIYIITRILSDCQPKKIIELGLGESSKIVSKFVENELPDTTHLIVEQSLEWIEVFKSKFKLSSNSTILHLELETNIIKGFPVNTYKDIGNKIDEAFDLYIIDGPFGSSRYSRYDIISLTDKLNNNNEFIIVIDDYNRQGEQDTAQDLTDHLTKKGIEIFSGRFAGDKAQKVIVTKKYQFVLTI